MAKASLKKNTVFNAVKTCSAVIFPLITFPYISRTLLVENIGKINFGLSFVSYFALLASLGINVYAIRECSKCRDDREQLSKIASEIFSLDLITTILSYILLGITLLFYSKVKEYRGLIVIQSLSIIFVTLGADWINTAMEDFKYITLRTIIFQILSLSLMLAFIHKPEDYIKYAIISVLSSSGSNITNIIYRKKYCDIKFTFDINYAKHFLPIFYLFAMQLAQTIFNNIDMTMLGIMKGDYSVGIYSTAHKISNIINQVVASLLWVVIPRISYHFSRNDFSEINKILRKALNFNLTIGMPAVVGVCFLSNDIIRLFAGPRFMPSSGVLQILMIGFFISLFGGSFLGNIVLLSTNREKYYMVVCITTAVINSILNFIIIPHLDYIGAAITTAVCSFVILLLLLLRLDKRIKIEKPYNLAIQPIIGCIAISIVCTICKNIKVIHYRVIATVLFSMILYFAIQIVLKNTICVEVFNAIIKRVKNGSRDKNI